MVSRGQQATHDIYITRAVCSLGFAFETFDHESLFIEIPFKSSRRFFQILGLSRSPYQFKCYPIVFYLKTILLLIEYHYIRDKVFDKLCYSLALSRIFWSLSYPKVEGSLQLPFYTPNNLSIHSSSCFWDTDS